MINNDIMDEEYGKEMTENETEPVELSWVLGILGMVIIGCIASIIISLTLRLDRWLLH